MQGQPMQGSDVRGVRTLLDALVRQRRLTRNEARELLAQRAKQMGHTERRFALSERQFYRLLHGEVKTRPHPVVCRVVEAEFGHSIDDLLSPVDQIQLSRTQLNQTTVRLIGEAIRDLAA
jgi:hypothetical protein